MSEETDRTRNPNPAGNGAPAAPATAAAVPAGAVAAVPAGAATAAVPAARGAAGPTAAMVGEAVAERAEVAFERAGEAVERAAAVSGRVASNVVGRLRNDAELAADRGFTRIEDDVVEKVAGIAARSVPGVHDLGGDTARFFASMKDRVGLGEAGKANQGVSARLDGRAAKISVTLMVEYGVRVYPITEQVRAAVIEAVERMLDLQVSEVNVVVDDVQVPEPS